MTLAEFKQFSDKLIELVKQKNLVPRSCNFLLCKPVIEEKTEGGIVLSKGAVDLTQRRSGYARVVAVPNNIADDPSYNDIRPGDWVMYNHEGHYKPPIEAIRMALGVKDFPENYLYLVLDKEILFTIPEPKD